MSSNQEANGPANQTYLTANINLAGQQPVTVPPVAFVTTLTRKQSVMVKHMIDNPKASATEAAALAYDVANRNTARSIAAENMAKPAIIMALGEHAELFESAIVGTVREWKDSQNTRQREIAMQNAQFGHDKVFGKATVKLEQQSTVVRIAINLTGDGEQPPAELL